VFLWGWDAGFARGTEQDTGFQFLRDLINCYWPGQKPQAGRNELYSCVRFQVMNSNHSVPCQVLSNVSSISYIFDACVCNLDLPILSSFSSLSTFSKALGLFWPGWTHRMAMIVIYRTKSVTLQIASPYIRPGMRAGMPSFGKKSSEPRFQVKWRRWKLWKKLSSVFTAHLLNMEMNNLFLSLIRGKRKQNSKPFTERNVIITCAYVSATHWILLWSCMQYLVLKSLCQ